MAQTSEIFNDQLKYLQNCFVVAFQSLSCVQLFALHRLQHASLPYPSLSPRIFSYSYPLIRCCYLTNSSFVTPFSSSPWSSSASGSFFNESSLCIRCPSYCSFSFSISPSNENSRLISLGLTSLILQSRGLSRVFSSTTIQKHQFFGTQPSLWSNSHIHTWLLKNHSFDYMDFSGQSDVFAF